MIQKSVSFLSELLVLTVWNFLEARINKHFFSRQVLDPLEVSSLMRSNSYIITLEEKYLILGHRGLAWSKLSQRPLTKHTALAIHSVFLQWCPWLIFSALIWFRASSQPWQLSSAHTSCLGWCRTRGLFAGNKRPPPQPPTARTSSIVHWTHVM